MGLMDNLVHVVHVLVERSLVEVDLLALFAVKVCHPWDDHAVCLGHVLVEDVDRAP